MSDTLTDPGNKTYNIPEVSHEKIKNEHIPPDVKFPPPQPVEVQVNPNIKPTVTPAESIEPGLGKKNTVFSDNDQVETMDLASDANRGNMGTYTTLGGIKNMNELIKLAKEYSVYNDLDEIEEIINGLADIGFHELDELVRVRNILYSAINNSKHVNNELKDNLIDTITTVHNNSILSNEVKQQLSKFARLVVNIFNFLDRYKEEDMVAIAKSTDIEKFSDINDLNSLVKTAKDDSLKKKLMEYFKENKNPSDSKIHSLAEKWGMDPDDIETAIYKILSSFLSEGKSKNYKGNYDEEQLKMGIRVEMEHTSDPDIAERIAKDHLSEFGGGLYYTALKEMEKELEVKKTEKK